MAQHDERDEHDQMDEATSGDMDRQDDEGDEENGSETGERRGGGRPWGDRAWRRRGADRGTLYLGETHIGRQELTETHDMVEELREYIATYHEEHEFDSGERYYLLAKAARQLAVLEEVMGDNADAENGEMCRAYLAEWDARAPRTERA